ncbi:hypothetical protein [Amycolatopsis alba]|uniref:Uncharacterized protein n=1 Tax=Amycolatopsis alba DSM 44262 TaxID=1125972 RepID=A0A229RV55_AMYAL|nr:hypothetical protein [Amycolatopsis alba]OXM50415.1 hypothetical protein CFP75_16095 [Amycolatopsis alba DSM 44262]
MRLPDGKQIVLSSDAAHLRSNIDQTTGMPLDVSNPDEENGLRKLKLLASRPDTTVWVNHDPGRLETQPTQRTSDRLIPSAQQYAQAFGLSHFERLTHGYPVQRHLETVVSPRLWHLPRAGRASNSR